MRHEIEDKNKGLILRPFTDALDLCAAYPYHWYFFLNYKNRQVYISANNARLGIEHANDCLRIPLPLDTDAVRFAHWWNTEVKDFAALICDEFHSEYPENHIRLTSQGRFDLGMLASLFFNDYTAASCAHYQVRGPMELSYFNCELWQNTRRIPLLETQKGNNKTGYMRPEAYLPDIGECSHPIGAETTANEIFGIALELTCEAAKENILLRYQEVEAYLNAFVAKEREKVYRDE